jgi:CheY-like chemotaxis protein
VTKRVLMVDDEEDVVWSTARQVARERPDLDFQALTDPEEALAQVRKAPPDLLVTDIRMPRMSGLELIVAARSAAPALPVIVVTAYGTPEVRAEVQRAQHVDYIEKPFTFQTLLAAVDQALARNSGFSGAISLPMLPDLIQIYAISRTSGTLKISRGGEQGTIWFQAGDIVHATCGDLKGEPAVFQLLTWDGGSFALDASAVPPEQTIEASWQQLLVEGCRLLDEGCRDLPAGDERADQGAPPPVLDDRADAHLWAALVPQLREAAPQGLVVTLGIREPRAWVRQGGGGPERWPAAVAGLLEAVTRVCGDSAALTVECVSAEAGIAVVFDRVRDIAVVFADEVSGRNGASRFRSNVARWREWCRPWMRCD